MPCFENRRIPPAQVVYLSFTAMCIFIYDYLINAKNRRLQVQCIIILFYWHWHMRWSAKGLWPVLLVLIAVPGTARAAASSDNRHRPALLPLQLYSKGQLCYPRFRDEILDYYWLCNLLHLLRGHTVRHVLSLSPVSRVSGDVWFMGHIFGRTPPHFTRVPFSCIFFFLSLIISFYHVPPQHQQQQQRHFQIDGILFNEFEFRRCSKATKNDRSIHKSQ